MTPGSEMEKEDIVSGLRDLTETIEKLLLEAKAAVKESVEQFVESKIVKLFHLASAYKNVLQRCPEVREACDEWNDLEDEWDTFLKDVDSQIEKSGPDALTQDQVMSLNQPLVNARTSEVTCLKDLVGSADESEAQAATPPSSSSSPSTSGKAVSTELMARQEEFYALNSRLVLVSFGVREGAQQWLKDMDCPFPMLLDSSREIYHQFGLTRSLYKVWSVSCMVYYGEQMRAGKKLPSPYENVHDDVNQMGGDFIVSAEGKLLFCYCSQTSSDRPSVDALLSALKAS